MYYQQLTDLGIKLRRRGGLEKTVCPKCSDSRRNKKDPCLSVNVTEGVFNCHHCGWKGNVKTFERAQQKKQYKKPDPALAKNSSLDEKVIEWFNGRGISENTLQKFFIHTKSEWMPQTQGKENCIVFPYIRDEEVVNAKFRDGRKNFKMVADAELVFFGMQTLKGRKAAIIHEGECDALTAYEIGFGQDYPPIADENGEVVEHELGRWAVLSVPSGASKGNQKLEYLDNCAEWLAEIEEFIIATDGDEAGQILRDELVRRLGAEKCRVVNYPKDSVISHSNGSKRAVKDLNEVLVHFGIEAAKNALKQASAIPVDGIYYLENVFESMLSNFHKGVQLAPKTHFGEFDEYFRWKKGEINLFTGYANWGKALALDTKIPTPNGFVTMGDIKKGDVVFDENGKPCNVLFAHQIMYDRPCYEVVFSDGTKLVADEEHLWVTHTEKSRILNKRNTTETDKSKAAVRTTKEILDTLYVYRKDGTRKSNHSIEICKPIECEESNLLIEPYLLGAWLGDGTSWSASISSNDKQIVDSFDSFGYTTKKWKDKYLYGVSGGFIKKLRELNLIKNKHIPPQYMRASVYQRVELLRGLMDTDGYISNTGFCEFATVKEGLFNQVYELICSLGIKAYKKIGDAKINGRIVSKKYRIMFKSDLCPFNLKRKKAMFDGKKKNNYRTIVEINKVDSVPVRCITVDSPNSMYLCTESFIPTHNTFFVLQLMLTKSFYDGWKWAIFSPENYPANDFYDDLVEMYVGKTLKYMTEEEYVKGCGFINDHIFYVYPENDHDIESVHEKFRYLILKKGVDGVLVDPFNQLDKTQKPYERDDQYLSVAFKDIKRFALLNGVSYNIIAHPKNPSYRDGKQLPVVDMYDLHGGAMWANKMDNIVIYHRPNFHENPNDPLVEVHMRKVKRKRTGGKHGNLQIVLDWSTKRYTDTYGQVFLDTKRQSPVVHNQIEFNKPSPPQEFDPF